MRRTRAGTRARQSADASTLVKMARRLSESGSRIEDSIVEADCEISNASLQGSVLGCQTTVEGAGLSEVLTLNIGDDSSVRLGASSRPTGK